MHTAYAKVLSVPVALKVCQTPATLISTRPRKSGEPLAFRIRMFLPDRSTLSTLTVVNEKEALPLSIFGTDLITVMPLMGVLAPSKPSGVKTLFIPMIPP